MASVTGECQQEIELARTAKARMQQLLDQPGAQVVDSGKRDRYGRPLVSVRLASGKTAGEVLIKEGFAVRWTPEYEADWCG